LIATVENIGYFASIFTQNVDKHAFKFTMQTSPGNDITAMIDQQALRAGNYVGMT